MDESFYIFIGLEIHLQLNTRTKLFCDCKVDVESAPNTHVCPICLGYPGTLPVLNEKAVEWAVMMGHICHSEIQPVSRFDRKNYFYPDLPKGYQITQYHYPICIGGFFEYVAPDGNLKKIKLKRLHLEEDAGKIMMDSSQKLLEIDYNRAGVPLIELVTEPEFHDIDNVIQFLKFLQLTARQAGISDASLEKGNMRCDVNISVSRQNLLPSYKTELKNLNSFKFIKDALYAEIKRQKSFLRKGMKMVSGTAKWNVKQKNIEFMRTKEEEEDYRYFPEPDLPPLQLSSDKIEKSKPDPGQLPVQKLIALMQKHALKFDDAILLVEDPALFDLFSRLIRKYPRPDKAASWINVEIRQLINQYGMDKFSVDVNEIAKILCLLDDNKINREVARYLQKRMLDEKIPVEQILEEENLYQTTNHDQLGEFLEQVIAKYPDLWEKYCEGEMKLENFFLGQIMKMCKGKGNPHLIKNVIKIRKN